MHPEHRFYDYGARLALSEDQTSSSSSTSTSPSSHIEPDRIPVAYFPNPDEETTEEVKEQEPGNASESDTADDQEGYTSERSWEQSPSLTLTRAVTPEFAPVVNIDRPDLPLFNFDEDLNVETNVESVLRALLDRSRQGHAKPS